jgi:hypothetical protein
MLQTYRMKFDGYLLERGFWLYVWEIKGPKSHHLYAGQTGDSSSPHAASPFKRVGQHLDAGPNAKGNALGKQLRKAGVTYEECTFEMVGISPIFPEQPSFEDHVPMRDQTAALERSVADELRQLRHEVLGTDPRQGAPDATLLQTIWEILDPRFPEVSQTNPERCS